MSDWHVHQVLLKVIYTKEGKVNDNREEFS